MIALVTRDLSGKIIAFGPDSDGYKPTPQKDTVITKEDYDAVKLEYSQTKEPNAPTIEERLALLEDRVKVLEGGK
jgi:hypothetical protein